MPDVKSYVILTNSNVDKMSRHDMLEWVNATVSGSYKKIEELCSGVAYCQIMEMLHPNCIGAKKVKIAAKLEHEYQHNLKLLQNAFGRLNVDHAVPIDRLVRGRFQDNFEFLQWFKKFFDTHSEGKNIRVPAVAPPKPIRRLPPKTHAPKENNMTPPKQSAPSSRENSVSPSSIETLVETQKQLGAKMTAMEEERDYYFRKLTDIEAILNEGSGDAAIGEWCKKALTSLYDNGGAVDYDTGDF